MLAFWAIVSARTLTQAGRPATEHLTGFCEQTATACLMAAWTDCVHENGAGHAAQRHQQLRHAGLGRATSNGTA